MFIQKESDQFNGASASYFLLGIASQIISKPYKAKNNIDYILQDSKNSTFKQISS